MAAPQTSVADPKTTARLRVRVAAALIALLAAIITIVLATPKLDGWPDQALDPQAFVLPLALVILAVAGLIVYVLVTLAQVSWSSPLETGSFEHLTTSPADVARIKADSKATAAAIAAVSPSAAVAAGSPPAAAVGDRDHGPALYVRALIRPRLVFTRISEQVEPRTASQVVRTSYTMSLPDDLAGRIVIPLFRAPRGQMQDGLRFFGPDEERLSSLTRSQGVVFANGVIRRLLEAASPDALAEYERWIEKKLIALFLDGRVYSDATTPSFQDVVTDLATQFSNITSLDDRRRQRILGVISAHLGSDVVCVAVEVPGSSFLVGPRSIRLTVERTDPKLPVASGATSWGERLLFRRLPILRRMLGVETTIYRHGLDYAELSASYHLSIAGPVGTYLAKQTIQPKAEAQPQNVTRAAAVLGPRRGQRHSHTYVRNSHQGNAQFRTLEVAATFYERPPGAITSAFLSAVAALIITLLIAARTVLPMRTDAPSTDLIAILLAFPAGIAIWAGFSETTRHSLSAYVSKFTTIAACIVAAFISVLGDKTSDAAAPTWFAVCSALAVNAVACGASLYVRQASSVIVRRSSIQRDQP